MCEVYLTPELNLDMCAGDGLQDEIQWNCVSIAAAAAEVISPGHLQHGREEHSPEGPGDREQELQGLDARQL